MILEFLKGELNSKRFNEDLNNAINELGLDSSIILNGNIEDEQENNDRLKIMKKFRGYPDEELFERFPNIEEWKFLELNESDIDIIGQNVRDYIITKMGSDIEVEITLGELVQFLFK